MKTENCDAKDEVTRMEARLQTFKVNADSEHEILHLEVW